MELKLADNIRRCRRDRKLTQEQFAEIFGVTTGAVHKWESGQSVPELELIMRIADFFDMSVDALLGYHVNDDCFDAVAKRLVAYCRVRDPEALREAEKLLKKHPNTFKIVLACADVYAFFSVGGSKKEALRALELYELALRLISQNSDPETSELTIYNNISTVYIAMGETEKAVRTLKEHNACGIFNDSIGCGLAILLGRPEEAEPFLTASLGSALLQLVNTVSAFVFVFCTRDDFRSAQSMLSWLIGCLSELKQDPLPDFSDKVFALLHVLLAHTELRLGQKEKARDAARKAAETAGRFDAAVNYGIDSLRYFTSSEQTIISDSFGATASDSVSTMIRLLKNPELAELWKEAETDAKAV